MTVRPPAVRPGPRIVPPGRARSATRLRVAVLAIGLLLIGLNLRIGVAAVGPVLSDIRADLGLSATAASLLTTLPVVAFGAFAFLTPVLMRRLGMHRLLGVTMLALATGLLLRLEPSLMSLFGGTIIVGAAIAIANVVMPAAIKRDFATRTGLLMGLYSTVLFVGASLASGLTVPLLSVGGGHWRPTLALWAIPAVIALLVWIPQIIAKPGRARDGGTASASRHATFGALLRDPIALAVTAHMGLQSLAYYAFITWAPTLLQDHGMSATQAGWMVSFSAFPAIAASLVTPAFARRVKPGWIAVVVSVVPFVVGYAGLAIAPVSGAYLWMTLIGTGQGIAISLALSLIVWRSPDPQHTAHVSTLAQGVGYLVAALGPLGLGALYARTGGWTIPIVALVVLLALQFVAGVIASQDRFVLEPRAARTETRG